MSVCFTLLPSPDVAPHVNEDDWIDGEPCYFEAVARILSAEEELGIDVQPLVCVGGITVPDDELAKVRDFLEERWVRQREELVALLEPHRTWLDRLLKRPEATLRQMGEGSGFSYPRPGAGTGDSGEVSTPWGRDLAPVAEAVIELYEGRPKELKRLVDKEWPDDPPGSNEQCLRDLRELMPKVLALARQAEEQDTYLISYCDL